MNRKKFLDKIDFLFWVNPVVALLGPRQCGKTTVAKQYRNRLGVEVHYFDLEDIEDFEIMKNPKRALAGLEGLIIIDEIQLVPDLFKQIRVLVDNDKNKKFLILGSASRDLIKQSSETLAGRISYIEMTPFSYDEVSDHNRHWLLGGFPRSYLAETNAISEQWRKDYIKTFLERDIPNLGFDIAYENIFRFWQMLTHYHGSFFKASEIGKSLMLSHVTIRKYLDILAGTFMIRELKPWYENISKRQVKTSKIYYRDTGIYHSLLGITEDNPITRHPKLGSSWEGYAIEQIIRSLEVDSDKCYFWSTSNQAELDLLVFKDGKRLGFEFKYNDAPSKTKSMHIALRDLKLDSLTIIYPGKKQYKLDEKISAVSLDLFLENKALK